MRQKMLTNDQMLFLQSEKQLLTDALLKLDGLGLSEESMEALRRALLQLDELFLLVVVGEFNAGKSAMINALLGETVLKEGVTPTTSRVTLLRYGEERTEQIVNNGFAIVTHPVPFLEVINIVDSPGTNAIIREHELLTNEYVPRSDLVLFATSADRPLTESERQFMQKILAWGKKLTLVVNKADILDTPQAKTEVRSFVMDHVIQILGFVPELFLVSARLAQQAQKQTDPAEKARLKAESGFEALERYITETLDDKKRLELKLRNPLGVLENLSNLAEANNLAQIEDLLEDNTLVDQIETVIRQYEKELRAEVPPRLAEVENILQRFELRGQEFFDDTFRLTNITTLAKAEKVKEKFEKEVVADVSGEVDEKVHNLIDWLVDKDLHTWYQVAGALDRRQAASNRDLPAGGENPHISKRAELISSVGSTIKRIINDYDHQKEADQLNDMVKDTLAQTALLEVGALGIGALVATIITSRALDVTGIVAAGALAVLGLFVIPFKRKQAKEQFKQKMDELREKLMSTLRSAFTSEFEGSIKRLEDRVAPYTQYVHEERLRLEHENQILEELKQHRLTLQNKIDKIIA
ncbi:MAG: dynamin family protein [Anaerolineaceae bacterium]